MRTRMLAPVAIAALLAACGAEEAPEVEAYTRVSPAAIAPGDDVPAPSGDVVLTLSGDITTTNVGDTLQFDLETLEDLGVVEYAVEDSQAEGRRATFSGVLVSDLLAVAGASADATNLHTVALNDYAVDIPVADVTTWPVLLATAVDGERMSVERYGPVRIVYPYDSYEIDSTIHDPRWIWQLVSIEVE